jgi:purine-cytosine permease-like protein
VIVKKFFAVLVGLAFVFGSTSSVRAADIPDEQWAKSGPTEEGGSWGIAMTDEVGASPEAFLL